jgi:hypothetical protein
MTALPPLQGEVSPAFAPVTEGFAVAILILKALITQLF